MNTRRAPDCMKCGLRCVYHRVGNPKQWRCRSCGHEFSNADLQARNDTYRREAEQEAAAREKSRKEGKEWEAEHGITGPWNLPNSTGMNKIYGLEHQIGRKFTKVEWGKIFQDLARPPHLREFFSSMGEVKISAIARYANGDSRRPDQGFLHPVWRIVALLVIGAVIIYACSK